MKNKKGFTLVELIVVISILAVLALILVPSIIGYTAKAKAAVGKANAKSCYSQLVAEDASNEAFKNDSTVKITIDSKCTAVKDGSNIVAAIFAQSTDAYYSYAADTGTVYLTTSKPGNLQGIKTGTAVD